MHATNTLIVKLSVSADKLKELDFTDKPAKKPRKRPVKPKPEAKDEHTSLNSGIITNGGADPISGTLPRTVKAAPVANTQGLVLDKTPCRKWSRTPITLKGFTGFAFQVMAWTSKYKPGEYEEKLANETKDKAKSETPDIAERKKPKSVPVSTKKSEDKEAYNEGRAFETSKSEPPSEAWDPNSEPMSEPQMSEPPSEAPSEDNTESKVLDHE